MRVSSKVEDGLDFSKSTDIGHRIGNFIDHPPPRGKVQIDDHTEFQERLMYNI